MTPPPEDDRDLATPDEAAFVRRVAEVYAPPAPTPARRAAFDAALATRIARDRWRFAPWIAAVATAGAAALLLFVHLPGLPGQHVGTTTADDDDDDAFVLALAGGSTNDFDSALPDDYRAISSLLDVQ